MRGKAAFKANYLRCVIVALIIFAIAGAGGGAGGRSAIDNVPSNAPEGSEIETITEEYLDGAITLNVTGSKAQEFIDDFHALIDEIREAEGEEGVKAAVFLLAGIFGAVIVIGSLVTILLINPLKVGCCRFFAENSYTPAKLGELGYGFRSGYGRTVGTMLLTAIFNLLWCLLLIIPGIIKAYSYRMVPYILAEEPGLSGKDVITRSRQMMNGNKWKAFVLDLSWILWLLLVAVTLGLAGALYVNPYREATNAELYHVLK